MPDDIDLAVLLSVYRITCRGCRKVYTPELGQTRMRVTTQIGDREGLFRMFASPCPHCPFENKFTFEVVTPDPIDQDRDE